MTIRRKVDAVRSAYIDQFKLSPCFLGSDKLPDSLLDQLSQCRSDEARRLILGISEKETDEMEASAVRDSSAI